MSEKFFCRKKKCATRGTDNFKAPFIYFCLSIPQSHRNFIRFIFPFFVHSLFLDAFSCSIKCTEACEYPNIEFALLLFCLRFQSFRLCPKNKSISSYFVILNSIQRWKQQQQQPICLGDL